MGDETAALLNRLDIRDAEDSNNLLLEALGILARCNDPNTPSNPTTGLAIGQIQSGKTSSFTVVTALARDNRFAMIILIAGTSLPLFRQSDARLKRDLRLDDRPDRAWMQLSNPTKEHMQQVRGTLRDWSEGDRTQTVLLTVMKNHKHLQHLADLLGDVEVGSLPTLIIDDEADQASLNNKVRRSQQSTTYRKLLDIRAKLSNHTLLQYTATPQAPLLISLIDALSPSFARVLTPGKAYTGGKRFFLDGLPLAEIIPDSELPIPANSLIEPPASLLKALRLFFLGVAADYCAAHGATPNGNRSMLIHPSMGVIPHAEYEQWVNSTRTVWHGVLEAAPEDPDRQDLLGEFEATRTDLAQTVRSLPPLTTLVEYLPKAIDRTVVTVMNATGVRGTPEVHFKHIYPHILIGGQALDRGFTVEGLTITYMPRSVGVGNVDTVQQRARFYGYKAGYIGYCRIFLERHVKDAYSKYLEHEESLQKQLRKHGDQPLSEWKRAFLLDRAYSPTRRDILGFEYEKGDYADKWFEPVAPHRNPEAVAANIEVVKHFVEGVRGWAPDVGEPDRTPEQIHLAARVPAETILAELLAPLRIVDPWDSVKFTGLLLQITTWLEKHPGEEAIVYQMSGGRRRIRGLDPAKDELKNLFQGKNPKSGRIIYPGDAHIRDNDALSVQVHTLNVDGTGIVAPAVAVWLPGPMSKGWVSAKSL